MHVPLVHCQVCDALSPPTHDDKQPAQSGVPAGRTLAGMSTRSAGDSSLRSLAAGGAASLSAATGTCRSARGAPKMYKLGAILGLFSSNQTLAAPLLVFAHHARSRPRPRVTQRRVRGTSPIACNNPAPVTKPRWCRGTMSPLSRSRAPTCTWSRRRRPQRNGQAPRSCCSRRSAASACRQLQGREASCARAANIRCTAVC